MKIYEIIRQEFYDKTEILPEEFLKYFKNNENTPFDIPTDVKNNLIQILMEQGLYAQVVMLCQKYLKIIEENKIKMRKKSISRVRLQDHSVCLILILIALKKISAHMNLISK